ncbi:hypothetical protein [Mesorhizobium sp. 10J20-29]
MEARFLHKVDQVLPYEQGAHHLSQEEIEEVSQVVRRWEEAEQAVIADIFD